MKNTTNISNSWTRQNKLRNMTVEKDNRDCKSMKENKMGKTRRTIPSPTPLHGSGETFHFASVHHIFRHTYQFCGWKHQSNLRGGILEWSLAMVSVMDVRPVGISDNADGVMLEDWQANVCCGEMHWCKFRQLDKCKHKTINWVAQFITVNTPVGTNV